MSLQLPANFRPARDYCLIGVTGAPGSGKSAFTRACAEVGMIRVDADDEAHQVLHSAELRLHLIELFGQGVIDPDTDDISRPAIAGIVFKDPTLLDALTALIHPRVRARFRARVAELGPGDILVYDVPLLFEAGLETDFDLTITVSASARIRAERLEKRSNWSKSEFERREAAQLPLTEKEKRADLVIMNEGPVEELRELAEALQAQITNSREPGISK